MAINRAGENLIVPGHPAYEPKVFNGDSQGLCETTMTPRFNNKCSCKTYKGNLGPCAKFEVGGNKQCVYCDHDKKCHVVIVFPYIFVWDRKGRKGTKCRTLTRSESMNSCAVEFEDGYQMVTSRNSLRRSPEFPNSIAASSKAAKDSSDNKQVATCELTSRTATSGPEIRKNKTRAGRVREKAYPSLSDEDVRSIAAIPPSS